MKPHRVVGIAGGMLLLVAILVGSVSAASVTPVFVDGNPTCADLGFSFEFKVDPPSNGTWDSTDGVGEAPAYITVSNVDGIYFDWASNLEIKAVIAKGGPNANVYDYNPPPTWADTDLRSPINPENGQPYGLSHISFCYDDNVVPQGEPLDVSKTGAGSSDLTYEWTIAKDVDETSAVGMPPGTVTFNYTVTVSHDAGTEDDDAVGGVITVSNSNAYAVTGVDISDTLDDGTVCTVTGGNGASIPANGSADFNYTCAPADDSATENTVEVSWPDQAGPPFLPAGNAQFTKAISWTQTVIDECIDVDDTLGGALGTVCVGDANPTSFMYSIDHDIPQFGCADYDNVADFETDDTGSTRSDSVTVTVCSEFDGCTPGYWKNHLDSWAATGYSPAQTLGSVFASTSPYSASTLEQALSFQGGSGVNGAKQILLRAAVAALLNASHPDVDYAMSAAEVIADVTAALASGHRGTMLSLATQLDEANNAGCSLN